MDGQHYADFIDLDIQEADPDTNVMIGFEEERQTRKLILIPSESIAPRAVRQALGSVFNNIYAEGYPSLRMTRDDEKLVLEHVHQLAYYRRYADRRFYKGVEYADAIETLAQRRCAQCFATESIAADQIFVNVQPLSGAAANLGVYQSFLKPGDTLMGLNLFQGGHLTHGSEFNLSGRLYKVVSYNVNRSTEKLDYDEIASLAREHRPRIIVAGYTSYPWAPDWARFRAIADEVGALLLADISHTAGMAIAGAYPNPVGYADVITCTTHKTICGPRGAVIITTDEEKAQQIDAAIFPGEQGGPHVNKFAAMAVAFKIAQTPQFKRLQYAIVENAQALATSLTKRGLKLAYGGTNTHMLLVDLRSIKTPTGAPLRGEVAARMLDLCGIVVNKNTIPGDELTALGSGIRMGTPWITQRGMNVEHLDELAGIIDRVLTAVRPFKYVGLAGELPRGKISLPVLEGARRDVDALIQRIRHDRQRKNLEYPHKMVVSDPPTVSRPLGLPVVDAKVAATGRALLLDSTDMTVLRICGWRAKPFLQQACTGNVAALAPNHALRTFLLDDNGKLLDDILVARLEGDARCRESYVLLANAVNATRVKSWLRALSDGYIVFDHEDLLRKVEGPATIEDLSQDEQPDPADSRVCLTVVGPDGSRILERLGAPALASEGTVWIGNLGGISVTAIRLGYGVGDARIELLVHPSQAAQLWREMTDAGATPRDQSLQQSLRARAELPEYDMEWPGADELYAGHKAWFSLTKPYFVGQQTLAKHRPAAAKQEFAWSGGSTELNRTVLYEEHRKRTTKIIPFAGWEMPVWYTSVSDEHQAVRHTAGLFDVSHMGVLDIQGEHAASFLDVVATNYARWIDPGQSAYAFLLDPDGNVMDDFIMYRQAWDHYLLVVNAANVDKDLAWLRAVNSRQFVIDRHNPGAEIEGEVAIRDLRDPSSGADQRVDLALQGPNSLAIVQSLTSDPQTQRKLAGIRRTDHARVNLAGFDLLALRTGYTGEEVGFELLVHPERAVDLWNLLLDKGASFGLQPCGLGARDSTRIEAGLPLYGHELAGDHDIAPSEAGFAAYVKLHKPFFVGRQRCVEIESTKKTEVLRFRVGEVGVRALRGGDAVVNKRGQFIGRVTSCTLVGNRQIGLAYVERRYNEPGTEISVFPSAHGDESALKALKDLAAGDKMPLPVAATVLTRLPSKTEKAEWSRKEELS